MRLQEIINVYPAIDKLAKIIISFDLAKFFKKVKEEFLLYENEKNKLVMKYGEKNEKENRVEIKADSSNYSKFLKEFEELISKEIDFKFEKIKIKKDSLNNENRIKNDIHFDTNDIILLEKFIDWID